MSEVRIYMKGEGLTSMKAHKAHECRQIFGKFAPFEYFDLILKCACQVLNINRKLKYSANLLV